ncbi:MAG: hypothetical protein AA931_01315 [Peptococcaceae bacterium 1109]|nr:MAG: hypothetical protein AA931_01315 [Peptococcaceae bacterium 1109]
MAEAEALGAAEEGLADLPPVKQEFPVKQRICKMSFLIKPLAGGSSVQMRDVTKIPHGKNQESVSSPCWQQIADALHDYQLMIDGAKDGLWMYNISSDRYVVSQKDRERFDFDPSHEVYSLQAWQSLLHPDDAAQAVNAFVNFLEGTSDVYENTYRLRSRDGSYRWVKSHGIADRSGDGTIVSVAGSHTDITSEVEQDRLLYRLAYYDELTRLPNRTKLRRDFDALKREGMAFLFVDVDDVSYVNSVMGYDVGDRLIEEIGAMFGSRYGQQHYVAKLDSDQFAVLLFDSVDLDRELNELLEEVRSMAFLGDSGLHVTLSIGVALYGPHGTSFDDLLRRANTALHYAKANGKDQHQFYQTAMENYAYMYVDNVKQIRKALAEVQFEMHYQPIVDAVTGRIAGREALLRWNHPQRGLVPPGEFIPLVEQSRQMMDLERWILDAVYGQYAVWSRKERSGWFVSINLSARGLLSNALDEYLDYLTETHEVEPGYVELEITETALLINAGQTLETLYRLHERGFRIALDDFGTGYSSLHYLKTLPIDMVKLDRSFIRTVETVEKDRVIVSSVVDLAHRMGLTVVAEGVETASQDRLLRELGCDLMQGYFYGRPEPVYF